MKPPMTSCAATSSTECAQPPVDPVEIEHVRSMLLNNPMSAAQWLAVAACVLLNMLDGFDILAAAFAAPLVSREWHLAAGQIGLFLSAGLAGMTLGALVLAPMADRLGRRRTVLVALTLMTGGLVGSGTAQGLPFLLVSRLCTGLGVGTMLPTINTIAAEVSNARHKDLAVCLQGAGFPAGGTLGGFAGYWILGLGWRLLFLGAAGATLLLLPAILLCLPESIEFLAERRPRNVVTRLNKVLRRYRLPSVRRLGDPAAAAPTGRLPWDRSSFEARSLMMCASFFLMMFSFYFLTSWTPELLTSYGLSARVGISGGILVNAGGVVGDLVFAALSLRWPAERLGPPFMALCFVATILIATVPLRLPLLVPLAIGLGFLLFGSILSLYATAAKLYPVAGRTTGTGLALGLGRIGATLGPWAGGLVIAMQWDRLSYLLLMASPLLFCAALLVVLARVLGSASPARARSSV
jgi:MFS family permease